MEIVGSIIISVIQSVLFYGKEIGISMILFSIIVNGIIYYILNKKEKIQNRKGILLIIPILLLSSTYFIYANKTFYIANIFIIIALELIMYVILTNKKNYLKSYIYNIIELLSDTIKSYKEGIEHTKEKSKEHIKLNIKIDKEDTKKIVTSLVIVSVVIGIVIILLTTADSIFANLFSGMGGLLNNINIENTINLILRLAIIVIIYVIFLNLIIKIQKEYKKETQELKSNKNEYTITIKLLLIALNIIYLIFCFIQIKSLFAKINIDETFEYAEYARTGFFQLMFVSIINFAIIIIANKYNTNKEKIIKVLSLLLVAFTVIIAISSMYRMHMYEMEYGLTYLRIFVYIILITEILTLIPIIYYILNEKFDFIKWSFIIVVSIYCIVNYMNLEKIIINKNINRETNTVPIDYKYISKIISEDSYEILEKKLENKNTTETEKIKILNILSQLVKGSKNLSWQEFNISKWEFKDKEINMQKLNEDIIELDYIIKSGQKIKIYT